MHTQAFQTTQNRGTQTAQSRGTPTAQSRGTPTAPEQDPPHEQRAAGLHRQLAAIRLGAEGAASWLESSRHYAQLINGDGFVPVTARFDAQDLVFLGSAREQLLSLAELGLRLVDLHQPLDAGGITTDPASPILRCRSCMWRWPCPTFRIMAAVMDELQPQIPS